MIKKLVTGILLCSLCFSSLVYAESDKADIATVRSSCQDAIKKAKNVTSTMTGTADVVLKVQDTDFEIPLKGEIEAETSMKTDPFGIHITADVKGKMDEEKEASFEFFIVPDETEKTDDRIVYFGMDSSDDKEKETTWKRIDINKDVLDKTFKLKEDKESFVFSMLQDLSKFELDEKKREVNDKECYVLRASFTSDDLLKWYESKVKFETVSNGNTASASASASGAGSAAASLLAPEGAVLPSGTSSSSSASSASASVSVPETNVIVPEYDKLIRAFIEPLEINVEVDVREDSYLPERVEVTFDKSDWKELSKALYPFLDTEKSKINVSGMDMDVKELKLEYTYDYDDVDITLPSEAVNKAVKLDNKKETITQSTNQTNTNNITSASASSASSSNSSSSYTTLQQPQPQPQPEQPQIVEEIEEEDPDIDYEQAYVLEP